jgi:hypothetical protein
MCDEGSSKKQRSDKNDMDWLKAEINSMKESLREISARAREDSRRRVVYVFIE